MNSELSKRWLSLPEISIEYQNILMVNKQIVNIADISEETLTDYLQIGQHTIDSQLRQLRSERRYSDDPTVRPSILVGRLALAATEGRVITDEALKYENDSAIKIDGLKTSFSGFWEVIQRALYTPEVHRKILLNNPKLGGTWLGLRRS
jgi:hypothetical protein